MKTKIPTAPTDIQAMADNAIPAATELWRIAIDHRKTYMALSKTAAGMLSPIVDYYVSARRFSEAAEFVTEVFPDTIEKTLALQTIFAAEDKSKPELKP